MQSENTGTKAIQKIKKMRAMQKQEEKWPRCRRKVKEEKKGKKTEKKRKVLQKRKLDRSRTTEAKRKEVF